MLFRAADAVFSVWPADDRKAAGVVREPLNKTKHSNSVACVRQWPAIWGWLSGAAKWQIACLPVQATRFSPTIGFPNPSTDPLSNSTNPSFRWNFRGAQIAPLVQKLAKDNGNQLELERFAAVLLRQLLLQLDELEVRQVGEG